ncbi:hypothetical protein C3K47_04490 [Solitalea longa]|uniref:HTH tetR-type domain-containing protein n=1 Tax=Solitalea longa TaxID=2079460 RepID=A0A2S5A682_9SPHI|nr:TetR/AcrR family transcriptional regulator [Solitalea longa]POY37797.1 hypothetical protein C3K47_04490 [Solitalea longa]
MSQIEIQDDKQELIVDAALKRFAHFGPSKTTMNEIADDLRLSKALIYYYFPDKASLLNAVLEKILNNYFLEIECEANHSKTVEKALYNLIAVRHDFFMKFFFNMGLNRNFLEGNKNSLDEVAARAIKREKAFVATLLEKANKTGELSITNTEEQADLYIDLMKGIRFSYVTPGACTPIIDEDLLKEINHKTRLMTELFVKAHKTPTKH